MNTNWTTFLQRYQANTDAQGNTTFATEQGSAETLALCNLSQLTTIAVSGEDATSFLQGQFGNDINAVSASQAQISSYSSPKGRILSRLLVFKDNEQYLLQMPHSVSEGFVKRLNMFVLMSKVNISDLTDERACFGVLGNDAPEALKNAGVVVPENDYHTTHGEGVSVVKVPGTTHRFLCLATPERGAKLWESLAESATLLPSTEWQHEDILMGIPNIYADTIEAFVPQMVNLHLINGVSFKKGCYPGQEVVARMQYLGKLKRRMYLAHSEVKERPSPGDNVYSPDSSSGQGAGKVVDAQPAPQGGYDLLAVLEISAAEQGNLFLDEDNTIPLELKGLPYPTELNG